MSEGPYILAGIAVVALCVVVGEFVAKFTKGRN